MISDFAESAPLIRTAAPAAPSRSAKRLRYIRDGFADVVVAGGAEAPLSPLTFGAFDIIKTMSRWTGDLPRACRPFDLMRDGFVMGEGAASLIVRRTRACARRGAHIYAEVLGYSLNNDAFHMTTPLPGGESCIRAMREALADAQLAPEQIDYINAHASSTQLNDAPRPWRSSKSSATRAQNAGERNEGIHCASARRDRRDRGRDLRARARAAIGSAHSEPRTSRSGVRSRCRSESRTRSES